MKKLFNLIPLLVISSGLLAGQQFFMQMNFEDTTRKFVVYLPTGYTTGSHLPLVFNLHGSTSNGSQEEFFTNMDITANNNHFIACYPDGINAEWNSIFPNTYHQKPHDVEFISKLIDTLNLLYGVDLNRVYCCGMSNGGYQTYRMACELSNRIAAFASVTGTMTDSAAANCTLSRYVPILEIHGTADPLVPYNGDSYGWPVENSISFWLNKNQCSLISDTTFVPDTNTSDSSTVQKIKYRTCADGVEVWFFKIIDGGHSWPGAALNLTIYGPTNYDIDGSQEVWDFFNRYTLMGLSGVHEIISKPAFMNVYPNPSDNALNIECSENIGKAEVLNVLGKKVMEKELDSGKQQTAFDISGLSKGIYFLHVTSGDKSFTTRVVKE